MARFPSSIGAHLRPLGPSPVPPPPPPNRPSLQTQTQNPNPNPNLNPTPSQPNRPVPSQSPIPPLAGNQADLQMAYQDARRVGHPDFKRPFSSLEDACERYFLTCFLHNNLGACGESVGVLGAFRRSDSAGECGCEAVLRVWRSWTMLREVGIMLTNGSTSEVGATCGSAGFVLVNCR